MRSASPRASSSPKGRKPYARRSTSTAATLEVFATATATDQHSDLQSGGRGLPASTWNVVTDDVVEAIADTVQPQGVVARCIAIDRTLDELIADRSRRSSSCVPTFVTPATPAPSSVPRMRQARTA